MTSTYTPNKDFELPGYNDYVDSWNTPVNTNFTELDTALGGSTLFNATGASGDTVLTVTQYRPPQIIVSGVLSANVRLVVPAGVGGQWTVTNGTTGAFTLSMASAAGGSNITIPSGSTIVSCDGSATGMRLSITSTSVQRVDTFSAGTTGLTPAVASVGNISLGGTLNIANGGTQTSTAPTSGQLLIGRSDGTYAVNNLTGGSGITINNSSGGIEIVASSTAGGTVTSIGMSAGTTGMTWTSSSTNPIVSGGTFTLGGTLAIGHGGTGLASTPASGQFPIGTGTAYALGTITNGGGIGISVVSGNIQLTNSGVISLTSSLSGISVGTGTGNVTLSGTLGVANGGTGATTSTGTGSVVLSNSPSLVTPALGTPSSGTLTNCTGYPSSALSGAVPVSAGGTGTTTAFTLGSVVFAGASGAYSQNNANFFWDNTNARLGIGTTTPTQKLSVTGNSIVSGNSYFSDTSYYAYVSGSSVWLNFDANDSIEYQRTTNQLVGYIGGAATFAVDSTGNFRINSGYGSVATAYGCRAWVNFNGTGTVAIRASGNVSSITDNGTGDYTVNFTNAMPDANYAMVAGATWNNDAVPLVQRGDVAPTSSSIRIWLKMVGYSAGSNDAEWANVAIFR